MSSMDQSIPILLRGICHELEAATADDTVSLARPRAKLAWIASLVPASGARRLLDAAVEATSAIGLYEAQAGADVARLDAARSAVGLAAECIQQGATTGDESSFQQAGQRLLGALGHDPGEWMLGVAAAPRLRPSG